MTLVCAPAGYGKTTLLASVVHLCPDLCAVWISLDEDDRDPVRFLRALVTAFRRFDSRLGADAEAVLAARPPDVSGSARRVLDSLVNDVVSAELGTIVLALDDLHRTCEPAVMRLLHYLVERRPETLRVLLATRDEPPLSLARWRASGVVSELRLDTLAFTLDEVEDLLNRELGLALSRDQIELLRSRTEGWPAGVSLLAEALLDLPESATSDDFLSRLARMDRQAFEFLTEEVLDRADPEERSFLLSTSILSELSPRLAAAVSGREDSASALEKLYRKNFFVVALDERGTLFRYHDLFRDALRHRLERELPPAEIRKLHLRASEAEDAPSKSFAHLVAAGLWEEAARRIEEEAEDLLQQGANETLREWISAIPEDVRDRHPRLSYTLGRAAWLRSDLDGAAAHLQESIRDFEATGDETRLGEALAYLSHTRTSAGDLSGARAAMERARSFPLPPATEIRLLLQDAWLALADGRPEEAIRSLDAALDAAEEHASSEVFTSMGHGIRSHFIGAPRAVDRFERFCRMAARHAGEKTSLLRACLRSISSWAHQWRGRFEEADAQGEEALAASDALGGLRSVILDVNLAKALRLASRQDFPGAERALIRLFRELERPETHAFASAWLSGYLLVLGRVRLLEGRIGDARGIEAQMRAAERSNEWPMAPAARAMLRGLIELHEGNHRAAEETLRRASSLQQSIRLLNFSPDARVVLAGLYWRWGKPDKALEEIRPVLEESSRERTPGALVSECPLVAPLLRLARDRGISEDHCSQVLALRAEPAPEPTESRVRVSATGEILSEREVEVLRLIARGASNAAIADTLFISIHTVKRHVANVLRKLAADSRTEAAALAREMGLS